MPKIYEYLGIILFFYAREHEPIHVHARHGKCELKAEFEIRDGEIISVSLRNVKGYKPLKRKDLKNFQVFIDNYGDAIVHKWIEFFVHRRDVTFEKINVRLK